MKQITKCINFGTEEEFAVFNNFYLKLKEEDKKLKFSKFVRDCINECIELNNNDAGM